MGPAEKFKKNVLESVGMLTQLSVDELQICISFLEELLHIMKASAEHREPITLNTDDFFPASPCQNEVEPFVYIIPEKEAPSSEMQQHCLRIIQSDEETPSPDVLLPTSGCTVHTVVDHIASVPDSHILVPSVVEEITVVAKDGNLNAIPAFQSMDASNDVPSPAESEAPSRKEQVPGPLPAVVELANQEVGHVSPAEEPQESIEASPKQSVPSSKGMEKRNEAYLEKCTCKECGQVLSNPGNLVIHMRSHSKVQPFTCTRCSKKFSTKANLQRHEKLHDGIKPFECSICQQSFAEKRTLQAHKRIHTGERPYECEVCQQRFNQPGTLANHRTRHTKEKKHVCDMCDASFRQSHQLTVHKRRHLSIKPHRCATCKKDFVTKHDLVRHIRTHTGEKPHSCPKCAASFSQASYLAAHLRNHDNPHPYTCDTCHDAFKTSNGLKSHMTRTGHQNNTDSQESIQYVVCTDDPSQLPASVIEAGEVEVIQEQEFQAKTQDEVSIYSQQSPHLVAQLISQSKEVDLPLIVYSADV